jgi:hypothetical protein
VSDNIYCATHAYPEIQPLLPYPAFKIEFFLNDDLTRHFVSFRIFVEVFMSAYADSDLPHPDASDDPDTVHSFAPIIEFFLVIMLGLYRLVEFLTELATLPFTKAPSPSEA